MLGPVFVIHHFSGIWIWNWNGHRQNSGLKYGMWNLKRFSVDWIVELDFILPEADCGMGIIIPKSTAQWIRIFEKQCVVLKTQQLLHKLQGQDEKPEKLRAHAVSAVLKLAKFLQMTRYLLAQMFFGFKSSSYTIIYLPTLKVKDVQKHLGE